MTSFISELAHGGSGGFHFNFLTHTRAETMATKVLVTRKFKEATIEEAYRLLMELRATSTLMPGFVTGQTLISAEDPYKLLVISTWTSKKKWEVWRATEKRKEIAKNIVEMLETPEHFEIFYVGEKMPAWVDMA